MTKRGRPPEYGDRVSTAIRLPADLHDRAKVVAQDRDTSINHLVVKALARYLDQLSDLP